MTKFLAVLLLCFTCYMAAAQEQIADPDHLESEYYSQLMGIELDSCADASLLRNVYEWLGTPYHYGGSGRRGIDCSSFVNKVYTATYQTTLERSSRAMWTTVDPVNREDLKEGDLLFFKIRRGQISHVGIYIGNDKFAHASVSNGVIVSDLNEPYYHRYFFKGGRLSGYTAVTGSTPAGTN